MPPSRTTAQSRPSHSQLQEVVMESAEVHENIRALSAEFATERRERQQRRELVASDFARLRDAGFLLTGAPVDHGGVWESVSGSTRPVCEMHPLVLNFWMATAEAPPPFEKAWEEQRRSIFGKVCEGAWWGTIASEP